MTSDAECPPPSQGGILEGFEARVHQAPQATALMFRDEQYTYSAVEKCSRRIAQQLRAQGAGVGSIVLFCLPKSPLAVFAMLGILRTGAAFAAVLPSYPHQRKLNIVQAAQAKIVLTDIDNRGDMERLGLTAISLHERDLDEWSQARQESALPDIAIGSAACIIFTSGSTGGK